MNKFLQDLKSKIHISGTEVEENKDEWVPFVSNAGIDTDDDNSKFKINGKVVQGQISKDKTMVDFIKQAFHKGYSNN